MKKYIFSIIVIILKLLNKHTYVKYFFRKSLSNKIEAREPFISLMLRMNEHAFILYNLKQINIDEDYRNYLMSVVYKHEKQYVNAIQAILEIDSEKAIKYKTQLFYETRNIKLLNETFNIRQDLIDLLDSEKQKLLIKYLIQHQFFEFAQSLIEHASNNIELKKFYETNINDIYYQYNWNTYRQKFLGDISVNSSDSLNIAINKILSQEEEIRKVGLILLINKYYLNEEYTSIINNIIPVIKNNQNLIEYIEIDAIYKFRISEQTNSVNGKKLNDLLTLIHENKKLDRFENNLYNLISKTNLTAFHITNIRSLIMSGIIKLKVNTMSEKIIINKRAHLIFYDYRLFYNNDSIDQFVQGKFSNKHISKIYNRILTGLLHSDKQLEVSSNLIEYYIGRRHDYFLYYYIIIRYFVENKQVNAYNKYIEELKISEKFKIYLYIAKYTYKHGLIDESLHFSKMAEEIDPLHKGVLRSLIRISHYKGEINNRLKYIEKLNSVDSLSLYKNEYEMAKEELLLYKNGWHFNGSKEKLISTTNEVLYIANKSFPEINGYTVRTQEIVSKLIETGVNVTVITKLGWIPTGYNQISQETFNGVPVNYINQSDTFAPNKTPILKYFNHYANEISNLIELKRPIAIHAASNYQNALPAIAAGKAYGVKTIYEVRGLWHFTTVTKNKWFDQSERFKMQEYLELKTCELADKIICISYALKDFLVENGIDEKKITVVPNGVDLNRFTEYEKNEALVRKYNLRDCITLGFIGSITKYEGLDLVIHAINKINNSNMLSKKLKMLIVGDGQYKETLLDYVDKLHMKDDIIFINRVPLEEVNQYYSVIDIAPFARIDSEVCHLVTPLKPYEAMAMGKKVVASNVKALREIVKDGENGYTFEVENLSDLIKKIELAHADATIGEKSVKWIKDHHDWTIIVNKITTLYKEMGITNDN